MCVGAPYEAGLMLLSSDRRLWLSNAQNIATAVAEQPERHCTDTS